MMSQSDSRLTVGQCATLACLLEVNAPKPGNVHRAADFDDATLNDFAASAAAIEPIMDRMCDSTRLGEIVLRCVEATRRVAPTNTNLGSILLLAPLACVPCETPLCDGVRGVLSNLTADDSANVYQAIRLANPGGLGTSDTMDVHSVPASSLLEAMRAAAPRDRVAAQYVTNFSDVLDIVAPRIVAGREAGLPLPLAIVQTHVQLLAEFGDSLIARKCGEAVNALCMAQARRVLESGSYNDESLHNALADFDFWLRGDGRRRNPGTTADLIAAGLFVCLRDGLIAPPFG